MRCTREVFDGSAVSASNIEALSRQIGSRCNFHLWVTVTLLCRLRSVQSREPPPSKIRYQAACGATIRAANPVCLCTLKNTSRPIICSANSRVLARREILLRCSMLAGIGTFASPTARYPANGRYQVCCGTRLNTVRALAEPERRLIAR